MTLNELFDIIEQRKNSTPDNSYVASLFAQGHDRITQKVGEEAIEVVIAAKNGEAQPLISETADLLFHLTVLLSAHGITPDDIMRELATRNTERQSVG
ncbi:MAG: phosphoribosyl-ATP diphosphatase [Corynebacteriales bacterium]|nr:phosphoribosyl-ATP diphosphatase [Mycobacteriales bacterium]